MTRPSAIRFFWVVMRPSVGMILTVTAFLAYASYLALMSPADFDSILPYALMGQMIAASSGYRDRLVRGHFDAVLAGCRNRRGVAIAHLALSIVPGLLVWITLGVVDTRLAGQRSTVFTTGGVTGFLYVSTVAWAASLRLGRNVPGAAWLIGLFLLATSHQVHRLTDAYGTSSVSLAVTARAAAAAMIHPLMLCTHGGYVEPLVLAIVIAATLAVGIAGVAMVMYLDAPLSDPT